MGISSHVWESGSDEVLAYLVGMDCNGKFT